MANEDLTVRLKADDQLTPAVKKAAAAVDKLDGTDVEITVQAKIDQALGALDELSADARKAAAAADALGAALGPELASKADLSSMVAGFEKAGLSLDEITQNADQLGAKLKEIGGESGAGLDEIGTRSKAASGGLDEVAKSAGSSKSVLANMVGNATQDLGALGGIAGSAGVAIGQMGEYMVDASADGDKLGTVLKNFAAVAGPIALITVVTQTLTGVLNDQKAAAEAATKRTKAFGDAMDGAVDKGAALVDTLKQNVDMLTKFDDHGEGFGENVVEGLAAVAKNLPVVGGLVGDAGQNVSDLIPIMKAAGFSAKDFADAIANGGRVGDTWWQTLREGVAAGKITEDQYTALSAAIEKYGIEATKAKTLNDFFNESTQQSSTHVKDLNDAYDAAARGSTAFADAQQEGADGAERINNLLRDQADALNAQADAAQSAADQQLDVQKALVDYGDTLKDHKKTSDDVRDSAINLAKAQSELSKKQAEAAGTTLSATNNLDNLNSNLLNTAATAKGPARSAILDYIGAVNQIPTETMTDIKAAIDRGDIDEANRLLAGVSQTRTSTVKADADTAAANTELANTANPGGRPRTAQIVATVSTTAASTALSQIRGAGPRSVTPAPPAGVGATPYGAVPAATGAGAVVIPVRFALPSAADLARQIGTIRLNTKASLAAENRITGTRS